MTNAELIEKLLKLPALAEIYTTIPEMEDLGSITEVALYNETPNEPAFIIISAYNE